MDAPGIASNLVAALIGGALSLGGSVLVLRRTQKAQADTNEREKRGLLRALYVEMNTIWQNFSEETKGKIESLKDGEIFTIEYPGDGSTTFAVYENNASRIGTLHDESLIRAIVSYYMAVDGMATAIGVNSSYLRSVLTQMTITRIPDFFAVLNGMPVERGLLLSQAKLLKKTAKRLSHTYAEVESRMVHSLGQAAAP